MRYPQILKNVGIVVFLFMLSCVLTFIIAILLSPILRWAETTFALELVGHSGPNSETLLVIYLIVLGICLFVWLGFRRNRV